MRRPPAYRLCVRGCYLPSRCGLSPNPLRTRETHTVAIGYHTLSKCAEQCLLRLHLRTLRPGGAVIGDATGPPGYVLLRPRGWGHLKNAIDHTHHPPEGAHPLAARQTHVPGRAARVPKRTGHNFFDPAQTRVGKSVQPASVATNMRSESAMDAYYGTDQLEQSESMDWESWWGQTGAPYAMTGNYPKDVHPLHTPSDTDAPDVGGHLMELKAALEQSRSEPVSQTQCLVSRALLTGSAPQTSICHGWPLFWFLTRNPSDCSYLYTS
jgi:hypothetical protein